MNITYKRTVLLRWALLLAVFGGDAHAAAFPAACNVAPLPITGTRIINVSSEPQLQVAAANLQSGDTVVLADGTYTLTNTLYINGKSNVTIRGTSGCDGVVLVGKGMNNASYGNVPFGIWSNSLNTTIAHLTIRDTYENEIIFNAGAASPHIYSVKLLNAGSQFIKANPTDVAAGTGVDNAIVEYSWIEYTSGTPAHPGLVGYTNGISAHAADNWTIRGNVFKNLHIPDSATYLWNPAVLMWRHSSNTVTERNVFINVDRAIAYGLDNTAATGYHDHSGGVIRNNLVYLQPALMTATRKAGSDASIIVHDSPITLVYHNTILTNGNLNTSIEFRFGTTGAEARNNLADLPLGFRDGGTATQSGNYLSASAAMFADPIAGNLHLLDTSLTRASVVDKVAALGTVPSDIDGDARPSGTAADIGADEVMQGGMVTPPTTGDATAPSVTAFSMPGSSTAVTVPVTSFAASDNVAVTGYRVTESATPPTAGSTGWSATPPTSFTFSGTGNRTAYAWAKDAAGNVSPARSTTIAISVTDTRAPAVTIKSPANGSTVGSSVVISATATDNVKVTKMNIYVDGNLKATGTSTSLSWTWYTANYAKGSHRIRVAAYDAAGNVGATNVTVYK